MTDAPAHAHTASCYWDLRECRWVCASERPAVASEVEPVETLLLALVEQVRG